MFPEREIKNIVGQKVENRSSESGNIKTPSKINPLFLGFLGGIIFLSFYLFFQSRIPSIFYQARDDGIITMSHARNLAEYGTISINPSGERVEGFSSPVEFWVYYFVYKINPISYKAYSKWQGIIFMFLLGFVFIQFFREDYIYALILTFISGYLLFSSARFTEWMGSGMENPIFTFLFLFSVYLLFSMFRKGKILLSLSPVIFLASIARAESIYIVFPLISFFVILWYLKFRKLKDVLKFAVLVLFLWLVYKLGEFIYFGSFFPNTALGEDIYLIERIKKILSLSPEYIKTSASYGWMLLNEFRIILLIVTIPILALLKRKGERIFLFSSIILLASLSFFYPFFFGPTRLDIGRTNTHLAVFVVLFFSAGLFWLRRERHFYLIFPLLLLFSLFVVEKYRDRPVYLCCSTSRFEKFRRDVLKRAGREKIPRPSFANVDLGAISWHKNFNIVDLGKLGSPILARLKNPVIIKDYLFEFAAPDFIEIHDWWSCAYSFIFTDKRFKKMYEPLWEVRDSWLNIHCRKFPASRTGIWIRRDIEKNSHSQERRFLNYLIFNLSLKRIKKELERCQGKRSILSCEYVTRNVYRFIPELLKRGEYKEAIKLFSNNRSSEYDFAILGGRFSRNWYRKAIDFLYEYEINMMKKPQNLIAEGKFKVYRTKNRLMLLRENCKGNYIKGTLIVKLFSAENHSIKKMSFSWKTMGFKIKNKCAAIIELPELSYKTLEISQLNKGVKLWEVAISSKLPKSHPYIKGF